MSNRNKEPPRLYLIIAQIPIQTMSLFVLWYLASL
nr:MAG TPA: hypothetical protein [Caudoviricetes sp.]